MPPRNALDQTQEIVLATPANKSFWGGDAGSGTEWESGAEVECEQCTHPKLAETERTMTPRRETSHSDDESVSQTPSDDTAAIERPPTAECIKQAEGAQVGQKIRDCLSAPSSKIAGYSSEDGELDHIHAKVVTAGVRSCSPKRKLADLDTIPAEGRLTRAKKRVLKIAQ